MKILLNIHKYDYGIKKNGFSFEYDNFYRALKAMGHLIQLFDYSSQIDEYGKDEMGVNFIKAIDEYKPDLIFSIFPPKHFSDDVLVQMKSRKIKSVIWMTDDEWLWESFSKNVCNYFDYVVTTDDKAILKYNKLGYKSAILSQWGFNPQYIKKLKIEKDIDVSFVGFINTWREYLIRYLKQSGINVICYGSGWSNGRVAFEEMNKVFNRSKIVLNISNSAQYDMNYLLTLRPGWNRDLGFKQNIFNLSPLVNTILTPKKGEHVKARFFEVTGGGSFLLSYYVKSIERFFETGKDVVTYKNKEDLVSIIKYYLKHKKERERIAERAYNKTIKNYSYEKILEKVLDRIKY